MQPAESTESTEEHERPNSTAEQSSRLLDLGNRYEYHVVCLRGKSAVSGREPSRRCAGAAAPIPDLCLLLPNMHAGQQCAVRSALLAAGCCCGSQFPVDPACSMQQQAFLLRCCVLRLRLPEQLASALTPWHWRGNMSARYSPKYRTGSAGIFRLRPTPPVPPPLLAPSQPLPPSIGRW